MGGQHAIPQIAKSTARGDPEIVRRRTCACAWLCCGAAWLRRSCKRLRYEVGRPCRRHCERSSRRGEGAGERIGSEPEHAGCGAASWLVAAAQALDLVAEAESQPSRQRVVVGVAGSPVIYTSLGENEAT